MGRKPVIWLPVADEDVAGPRIGYHMCDGKFLLINWR
jgi:hypothetical protein